MIKVGIYILFGEGEIWAVLSDPVLLVIGY
jgi:hypothetical protein